MQLAFSVGRLILFGSETVQVQALDDEPLDYVERVEPYGFSSRPKQGAQVYLCSAGGDRGSAIAVVIGDTRYQMALSEGGVALHDDKGNFVKIEGEEITAQSSKKAHIKAPQIVFEADEITNQAAKVSNTGDVATKGLTSANGGIGSDSGVVEMTGGLHAKDEIKSDVDVKARDISVYGHLHDDSLHAPTSPPKP